MTVDVTMLTRGRVPLSELTEEISAATGMEATVVEEVPAPWNADDTLFRISYRDPENRRRAREIRGFHSSGADHETDAGRHVGEGDHTHLATGAFGGAATVVRAVAARFGGAMTDESAGEDVVLFDFPAVGPAPTR